MDIDDHLQCNWLDVPEAFSQRVMKALPTHHSKKRIPFVQTLYQYLLSLMVFASAALGLNQLLGFVLTLWLASSAS